MKEKLILGLMLSVLFLFLVAMIGIGDSATGMSIIKSAGSVEFPSYAVFITIVACMVGFVFIKSHHDSK